jgi:phosphopantothenoylcysteine decarboxylase/phosphopantothenate--cysteine ligase
MAAAVADFRPVDPRAGKIKKRGLESMAIELEATQDILASVAAKKRPDQVVVGFAAEAGPDLLAEAQRKLEQKGLDLVVANDISNAAIGFESTENEVVMIGADLLPERPPRGSKRAVAQAILDHLERLAGERREAGRAG